MVVVVVVGVAVVCLRTLATMGVMVFFSKYLERRGRVTYRLCLNMINKKKCINTNISVLGEKVKDGLT